MTLTPDRAFVNACTGQVGSSKNDMSGKRITGHLRNPVINSLTEKRGSGSQMSADSHPPKSEQGLVKVILDLSKDNGPVATESLWAEPAGDRIS